MLIRCGKILCEYEYVVYCIKMFFETLYIFLCVCVRETVSVYLLISYQSVKINGDTSQTFVNVR